MQTIYVENQIYNHPRTQAILKRFKNKAQIITCNHYGEIFNRKSQNFRLQKQNPALIIAHKNGKRVLPTPEGFGIGSTHNYYFSHMLNCLYDCRYCFLQGMYKSANYVVFVNYDDFKNEILDITKSIKDNVYFFSGYDADSLAYDPVTEFAESFVPFFSELPNAFLELRTKSTNIRSLMRLRSIPNCIVAFSFTPEEISNQTEHRVPSVKKRLQAMKELANVGWKLGLRLDPLIYGSQYQVLYQKLINEIFKYLPKESIHSVSIGPLRFPVKMYQNITKLYPKDKLLAHPLHKRDNQMSYHQEIEEEMKEFVTKALSLYLDTAILFECNPL